MGHGHHVQVAQRLQVIHHPLGSAWQGDVTPCWSLRNPQYEMSDNFRQRSDGYTSKTLHGTPRWQFSIYRMPSSRASFWGSWFDFQGGWTSAPLRVSFWDDAGHSEFCHLIVFSQQERPNHAVTVCFYFACLQFVRAWYLYPVVIQKGDAKCPDSADMGTLSLLGMEELIIFIPSAQQLITIKVPYP